MRNNNFVMKEIFHAHSPILNIFLSSFQNFLNKKLHSFPSKSSKVESEAKIAIGLIRGFLGPAAAPGATVQCK